MLKSSSGAKEIINMCRLGNISLFFGSFSAYCKKAIRQDF